MTNQHFRNQRRKREEDVKEKPPPSPSDEPFAKFAAELQIEFFVKVIVANSMQLLQVHEYIITALIITVILRL